MNSNTEQQILDVAQELFLDKGFALTTTTEIARRVGCNQALVHYYFRTKEHLFEKIFEKKFILFTSAISLTELKRHELKDVVEIIITKHLEMICDNPKLPFLVVNEITTKPEKFQRVISMLRYGASRILNDLEEVLAPEIEKGNIRNISAFDLIVNILSLNIFMFLAKPLLMGVKDMSPEQFSEFVTNRKDEIFKTVWGGIAIKK